MYSISDQRSYHWLITKLCTLISKAATSGREGHLILRLAAQFLVLIIFSLQIIQRIYTVHLCFIMGIIVWIQLPSYIMLSGWVKGKINCAWKGGGWQSLQCRNRLVGFLHDLEEYLHDENGEKHKLIAIKVEQDKECIDDDNSVENISEYLANLFLTIYDWTHFLLE